MYLERAQQSVSSFESLEQDDVNDAFSEEYIQDVEVDAQVDYELLGKPETRKRLYVATVKLIERIRQNDIDTVIFLDRSARPFAWLMKSIWNSQYDGKAPNIRFVNIGNINEHCTKRKEFVRGLESATGQNYIEGYRKGLRDIFGAQFFNQKVLVVDEYSETGYTEEFARNIIEYSFPEANDVSSVHLFSEHGKENMFWLQRWGALGVSENGEQLLVSRLSHEDVAKESREYESDAESSESHHQESIISDANNVISVLSKQIRNKRRKNMPNAVISLFDSLSDKLELLNSFSFHAFDKLDWEQKNSVLAQLVVVVVAVLDLLRSINKIGRKKIPRRWHNISLPKNELLRDIQSYRQCCRGAYKFPSHSQLIRRVGKLRKEMVMLGASDEFKRRGNKS